MECIEGVGITLAFVKYKYLYHSKGKCSSFPFSFPGRIHIWFVMDGPITNSTGEGVCMALLILYIQEGLNTLLQLPLIL